MSNSSPSLSTYEAAQRLGMSRRQIQRWCKDRKLKGAYKNDPLNPMSDWRIPESTIDEILRLRAEQSEPA